MVKKKRKCSLLVPVVEAVKGGHEVIQGRKVHYVQHIISIRQSN